MSNAVETTRLHEKRMLLWTITAIINLVSLMKLFISKHLEFFNVLRKERASWLHITLFLFMIFVVLNPMARRAGAKAVKGQNEKKIQDRSCNS